MPPIASTNCTVRIVTPKGQQYVFAPAVPTDPLLAHAPGTTLGGLRSVQTDKDMYQACGGFHLVFEGLRNREGYRWDQVIPMRSLVFIHMERDGGAGLPAVDPTVMIGLTDGHVGQESYSEARPQRTSSIRGREISCVMVDAVIFYHPKLAANPLYGTMTLERENLKELLIALTGKTDMIAQGDPRQILRVILDTYLFVGGQDRTGGPPVPAPEPPATHAVPAAQGMPSVQHPLITTDLPNLPLSRLLVPNYEGWTLFDDIAVIPSAQFPTPVGSLWNALHLFVDTHFQEFFSRVEDGVSRIHFRGKPFLHEHIASGTRFKAQAMGQAFDPKTHEPTLQTLVLDPADILTQTLERDSQNVYNFFMVLPRGLSDPQDVNNVNYRATPAVITDPRHPSFVGRYGVRLMPVETPYLDAAQFGVTPHTTGSATPAPLPLKSAPAGAAVWADKANQYAGQAGIPPAERPWFVALIHQESGFDPTAVHRQADATAPQGFSVDQGIAQFNTVHGPTNVGLIDPFDPDNALASAARYWVQLSAQVGHDPRSIAAAYNVGAAAVLAAPGGQLPASALQHVAGVSSYVPLYQGYAGTTGAASAAQLTPSQQGSRQPSQRTPLSPGQVQPLVQLAEKWNALLQAWHDMGGEFFGGTLTVRGHPAWNIGHRMLSTDEHGVWEAYVEGIRHAYDMRTGQYFTTLRITRGWYLSREAAHQVWSVGRTTVTGATGGPPTLDPQTGAPTTAPTPFDAPAFAGTPLLPVRPLGPPEPP